MDKIYEAYTNKLKEAKTEHQFTVLNDAIEKIFSGKMHAKGISNWWKAVVRAFLSSDTSAVKITDNNKEEFLSHFKEIKKLIDNNREVSKYVLQKIMKKWL